MKTQKTHPNRRILPFIRSRLILIAVIGLISIIAVFVVFFMIAIKEQMISQTAEKVHDTELEVRGALSDVVNEAMMDDLVAVERMKKESGDLSAKLCQYVAETPSKHDREYSVIDKNGIVTASTEKKYIGLDIHDGKMTSMFVPLLTGEMSFYHQGFNDDGSNADEGDFFGDMYLSGEVFSDGDGFLLMGYDKKNYTILIMETVSYPIAYDHIGESGYLMALDNKGYIISNHQLEHLGEKADDAGIPFDDLKKDLSVSRYEVFGKDSWVVASKISGITIVGVFPVDDTIKMSVQSLLIFIIFLIIFFEVVFIVIYLILKKNVINSMVTMDEGLERITAGDLEQKIDVYSTKEFASLSEGINEMVDSLKGYIREEKERVAKELEIARQIQMSAMPSATAMFKDETRFSIFATINTAKDVGGDFFDHYMLGNTLCFVVADVSGKGIPAAMFMMRAKSVIKAMVESGREPAVAFSEANKILCKENDTGMFLTAWMGFLDMNTGVLKYVNAGHNPPVLIQDGKASYNRVKSDLLMGLLDFASYTENEIRLKPGDALYVYTDGVTEAEDRSGDYYGEVRLQEVLSREPEGDDQEYCRGICRDVLTDVLDFTEGAEQSDDITMLCIRYEGN